MRIVAAAPGPDVLDLDHPQLTITDRGYQRFDLEGAAITFWAEDEPPPETLIDDARAARTLLNVVDRPSLCDFIAPAVVSQGDLTIAISTAGASPAMAKRIRMELERVFGEEYALTLDLLRRVRSHLAQSGADLPLRRSAVQRLVDSPVCRYLRDGRLGEVDRVLSETISPDVSMASLGFTRTPQGVS